MRYSRVLTETRRAIARDYRSLMVGTRVLSRKYGYSSSHIYNILRREGVVFRTRAELGNLYRKSHWEWSDFNPDLAWAIGLLATDGHLEKRSKHRGALIMIATIDWELLDRLKVAVKRPDLTVARRSRHNNQRCLRISDTSLFEFLLEVGVPEGNKTRSLGKLRIPDGMFIPFLCGVIDGDGHLIRGRTFGVTSGSVRFLHWVKEELDKHLEANCCSVHGPYKDNVYHLYCYTDAARVLGAEIRDKGYYLLDRKRWF